MVHCCFAAIMVLVCSSAVAGDTFVLPSNTTIVEACAFENVDLNKTDVQFPQGLTRLESRAFAGTGIRTVYLSPKVEWIAADAFDGCADFHPIVRTGSYADQWCSANGIKPYHVISLGVASHTQSEIRAFIESHPADTTSKTEYRQSPTGGSFGGETYQYGLLTEETLTNAINMVNQVRYIAGLNADVTNAPEQEERLAAAAMVIALNGGLSHYPDRPHELADSQYDELYRLAYAGASSSNLYAGPTNLASSVLGYMDDSDSRNIDRVGHRRWILNPSMGKTTFGFYNKKNDIYLFPWRRVNLHL